MTLSILYGDRQGLFTAVDLAGSVRAGTVALTSSAQSGQISESTIAFEDPNGNLGHAGDQILGLKTLTARESSCPVNNRYLFYGYIHDREYVEVPAQALLTGEAVLITASVAGLNDESRYYVITGTDGNRPAETVSARLTWLLASSYISLYDNGLVVYPTTTMPANDYRNQTGADVLDDCAETVGYNWFIYIAEAVSNQPSLFFDDPNTSTAYPAILRISTVLADMDSSLTLGDGATHTWMPSAPAVLKRSPNTIASKQILAWAKGTTSGSRAATAATFGIIDATTADSRITTSTAAAARVNRLLWQSSTEEDVITCTLQLLRPNVNDVREGQRVSAKFRNLPGYKSAFSYFRVLERTVKQEEITDLFYTVDLVLSPQEAPQPVGAIVQFAYGAAGSVTMPNNVTVGNILVYAILRMPIGGPSAPQSGIEPSLGGLGGWSQINSFVETTNVGTVQRWTAAMYAKVATGTQPISVNFSGGAVPCCIWEVAASGSTLTGATVISADVPGPASTMDIGSLGSPAANLVALMVIGQFTTDGTPIALAPATGWTTDDENVIRDYGHPRPWWFGHAITTGAALEAEVVSSVDFEWCGIALLLPAP